MAMVSRAPKDGFVECVIGLTNSGASVTYRGYGKGDPIYMHVHDTPTGSATNGPGWCGTGLRQQTLSGGDGVQFKVWFAATNAPARILVNYKDTRLLDGLLTRTPSFVRSKLPLREWRSAEVRLSN